MALGWAILPTCMRGKNKGRNNHPTNPALQKQHPAALMRRLGM